MSFRLTNVFALCHFHLRAFSLYGILKIFLHGISTYERFRFMPFRFTNVFALCHFYLRTFLLYAISTYERFRVMSFRVTKSFTLCHLDLQRFSLCGIPTYKNVPRNASDSEGNLYHVNSPLSDWYVCLLLPVPLFSTRLPIVFDFGLTCVLSAH